MKYLKLLMISVLGFVLLFWGITLMFPSTTVISRAINIKKDSIPLRKQLDGEKLSMSKWLMSQSQPSVSINLLREPGFTASLFNAETGAVFTGDTLFFALQQADSRPVHGGIATYQLAGDSTTAQLFYVFEFPWYKPWEKMRMMMMDKAIGPGMDSALLRLKALTMQP